MTPRAAVPRRLGHVALLALSLAAAAVVCFQRIGDPPLGFHPTRQYRSALLARRFYLERDRSAPAWQRELATHNANEIYEFPLLQYVAALGYEVVGREDLAVPRAISALGWLAAGVLIFMTARRLAGDDGALASAGFFLLVPFGVDASRAFQPDGLMVALLVCTYLALLAYGDRGGGWRLAGVVASGGMTTLLKPMALFQIVAGFVAVWYFRRRRGEDASVLHLTVFAAGVFAIGGSFYAYQWVTASTLASVWQQVFLPHLLFTFTFWKGWLAQIWKVAGFLASVAAILGVAVLPKGAARAMLVGLTAGYAAFGLVFSYTTFTHDYYHMQLLPLVAVALAPMAEVCSKRLRGSARCSAIPTDLVLATLFVAAVLDASTLSWYRRRHVDFSAEVATYREVGHLVGHRADNVLLANYYAYPLRYYGELGGTYWPLSFDARFATLAGLPSESARARLEAIRETTKARYFVVTDLPEFRRQPELEHLLASDFTVRAETDHFIIYDLDAPRHHPDPTPGP